MKRIMAVLIAALLALPAPAALAQAAPGEYTGEAQGFGGPVTVTLTVDESGISGASVTGEQETKEVGGAALPQLEEQILAAQGGEIDGVAGATVTSTAVREALAQALAQASGETPAAVTVADGVYTATRESFQKEHVTVSVTVDGGKITDVTIDEITDNPSTITDAPCAEIPAAIVAAQSCNVDGVTGATFTSNAIKAAVRDCLEQAGGAQAFSAAPEKPEIAAGEDVQVDVLVIGGGAAGMTAALESSLGDDAQTPSGLSVMLVEKAGFLGGTTSVSGGGYFNYPDETGAYDDAWMQAAMESDYAIIAKDMQEPFNAAQHDGEFTRMVRTNQLLRQIGLMEFYDEPSRVSYFLPPENGDEKKWAGSYYAKFMNAYVGDSGIDLRLNTAATELVTDDGGNVVGAKVQDKTQAYTVYAKKVILACGGFAANGDLKAQYAPEFTKALVFCEATNTGDGFVMARDIGADYVGNTMFVELGVDDTIGIRPDFCMSFIFGTGKHLTVNTDGERFVDESGTGYQKARAIAGQQTALAWSFVDSDNEFIADVGTESDLEAGYVFKADSFEELAEMTGVPTDKLLAAVAEYNDCADGKIADPMGGTAESKDRLDQAPFYAMKMVPCCLTSLTALKVDGNCRVLNERGEAIGNLFAAGDLVLGNLLQTYNAGHGIGNAIYSADMAAATAKAEIESAK